MRIEYSRAFYHVTSSGNAITGLGFESENVESLVTAITKFINLPYDEKKKEMGIAARLKMEKEFDRNFVINAYLEQISKWGSLGK